MKCTDGDDLKTSEMLETKRKMAMFLDGMDAFDDYLKLTANVDTPDTRLRIDRQTQGILDDDDTSFLSDDSDDESSKNVRHRVIPTRGVRKDHSGDLERLFRPKCTDKEEIGYVPSQVNRHATDGAKRSNSLSKKPMRTRDLSVNHAVSEHGRRTSSSSNLREVDRLAPDLSENADKAATLSSHHSAEEHTKSVLDSTGHRRGRRVPPTNSIMMQQDTKVVPTLADPSCSVSHDLSRTESRGELRRSRGDLSSSEHSRPRLRRDTLYATKRLPSSGTSDLDRTRIVRPSSEIDFQRAAVSAAKKRQSAGKRISGGAAVSPPRDGSSRDPLRYSTANRNCSAELLEHSPSHLPRSKTLGTNLHRSAGPKRSFNNLNLVGVYSNGAATSMSPKRTVEDLRLSLKKNGGRNDIDDLVVKMTRDAKPSGLQTKRGNATWN